MEKQPYKRARVVLPGTFDLFHKGHEKLIDYALMIGDLTVTINSDKFSEKLGKKTIDDEQTRKRNIENYVRHQNRECEVYICKNETESIWRTISKAPCFRMTGTDWNIQKTSERVGVEETFWENNNIYLIYKDREPNISTTKLKCQHN